MSLIGRGGGGAASELKDDHNIRKVDPISFLGGMG
jgi:hypothetical protein